MYETEEVVKYPLRLPKSLMKRVSSQAKRESRSINTMIIILVDKAAEKGK